jgi:hypothetical protein
MYTAKPPPVAPALFTGTNCVNLRRPGWTIPEAERLQMHASTRPSLQLRLKFEMRYFAASTIPLYIGGSS